MAIDITTIGTWVYSFYIVSIFSYFLYKETALYKFAEYSSIAAALANYVVLNGLYVYNSTITPMLNGDFIQIIPLILGLSVLLKLKRETTWMSRPAIAVLVGTGAGLSLSTIVETRFVSQIEMIAIPLLGGGSPIDNLILVIVPLLIIPFFIFTKEHKGILGQIVKAGRLLMMIAFGALFGTGVMYRMSWTGTQILNVLRTIGLVPG